MLNLAVFVNFRHSVTGNTACELIRVNSQFLPHSYIQSSEKDSSKSYFLPAPFCLFTSTQCVLPVCTQPLGTHLGESAVGQDLNKLFSMHEESSGHPFSPGTSHIQSGESDSAGKWRAPSKSLFNSICSFSIVNWMTLLERGCLDIEYNVLFHLLFHCSLNFRCVNAG